MADVLDRRLGAVHLVEVLSKEPEAWLCLGHDRSHEPPRPRVVRLLAPSLWSNNAAAARFLESAKLQSSFTHPNVARCLSWAREEDGAAWALIEWVDSERLGAFIARNQRAAGLGLELDRAFALILQMTEGVKSLHNTNRAHGRLGLHAFRHLNQLSDEDWVQLLHLGMCADKEGKGDLLHDGSAAEQAAAYRPVWWTPDRAPTAVVDVYALVVCLYCMVTGNTPRSFSSALERLETTHPSLKRRCPELISFFRRVGTDEALYGTPSSAPLLLHTLEELRSNVRPAARAQKGAAGVLRGGGRGMNRTSPGLARTSSGLARASTGSAGRVGGVSRTSTAGRRSPGAAKARRGLRSKGSIAPQNASRSNHPKRNSSNLGAKGSIAPQNASRSNHPKRGSGLGASSTAERASLLDLQAPGKGGRDGVHERDLARLGHTIEEMGRTLKRLLLADANIHAQAQARGVIEAARSNAAASGRAAARATTPDAPAGAQSVPHTPDAVPQLERPRAATPDRAPARAQSAEQHAQREAPHRPKLPQREGATPPQDRAPAVDHVPAVSVEVPAIPSMRANLGDASVLGFAPSSASAAPSTAAGRGGPPPAASNASMANNAPMANASWGDASLLGLSPSGDSLLPPPMLPPPPSLALASREMPLPGSGMFPSADADLDELPDPTSFDEDDDFNEPASWPEDELDGLSWDDALDGVNDTAKAPPGWLVILMQAAGAPGRLRGLCDQLGVSSSAEPWTLNAHVACVAVEGATDNATINALLGRLMMGGAAQAIVVLERTRGPLSAQTLEAQLGEAMRMVDVAREGHVVASPRLIQHAEMERFFESADALARSARVSSAGWGRFET